MTAAESVERHTLAECEEIIDRGLQTFLEVGLALIWIRDDGLYKASYDTFEEYCWARWGLARQRAYALMGAANTTKEISDATHAAKEEMMSEISDISPIPTNEGQAKELRGLEPAVAIRVMTRAAESGKITARAIARARRQIVPRERPGKKKNRPPTPSHIPDRERDRRLIERGKELYVEELKQSYPDLLLAWRDGVFGDGEPAWEKAWRAKTDRKRLAEALHMITRLAEDPDVDLDWVPHASLVDSIRTSPVPASPPLSTSWRRSRVSSRRSSSDPRWLLRGPVMAGCQPNYIGCN